MSVRSPVAAYMSPHPLTLVASDSVANARDLFVDNSFTVAPVVDHEGRCVGVISASDLMRRARDRSSQDVRVGELMTTEVVATGAGASIAEAASILTGTGLHHLMVLDDMRIPTGVLSTMDIARALSDSDLSQPAEWIMNPELITVDPGDSPQTARELLREAGVSSAPVVDGGAIIGVVTQLSLLRGAESGASRADEVMESPVRTVRDDTSVAEVARIFAEDGIRRVFIVDDSDEGAIGVLTTTDVSRFAASLYDPATE